MTLHLSLPADHLHSDTLALIDLISDLRGCNRRLDAILNELPALQSMTPMGADADGVSRGLVGADEDATYVILLGEQWALHVQILPRSGATETHLQADIPARLRRQFGPALGTMGVAA